MGAAAAGFPLGPPDPIERRAVLTAVKTASRRLERWPSASLDCRCARHAADPQAGTEKRPTPNQETSQNPIAIAEVTGGLRARANEIRPLYDALAWPK